VREMSLGRKYVFAEKGKVKLIVSNVSVIYLNTVREINTFPHFNIFYKLLFKIFILFKDLSHFIHNHYTIIRTWLSLRIALVRFFRTRFLLLLLVSTGK